jgi:hypothetical protein
MDTFRGFLEERALDMNLPKMYMTFNRLYFNNELPKDLKVGWYKNKKLGGEVSIMVRKINRFKREIVSIVHLKISNLLERSKKDIVGIMLHEMVHVWVAVQGIDEAAMHGPVFREKLKEIAKKSGIVIPATEAMANLGLSDKLKEKKKTVGVVLYVKPDMKAYVQLFSETTMTSQFEEIKKHYSSYEDILKRNYRVFMVGIATTSLHHQHSVKRKWKRDGVGGGSAITPEEFKELSQHWKEHPRNIFQMINA